MSPRTRIPREPITAALALMLVPAGLALCGLALAGVIPVLVAGLFVSCATAILAVGLNVRMRRFEQAARRRLEEAESEADRPV